MRQNFKTLFVAATLGGLCALAGCGSSETGEVRLGVSVAPLTELGDPTTDPRVAAGLELSRVRVLVNVAKVGYTGGRCNSDADGDETAVGPFVVELTGEELAAGATRSFSLGEIEAGTYGGAEIEIDVLADDADTSADPALADFATSKASVLVDGTWNGAPFQFAGHFLAEQGTDGEVTIDTTAGFDLPMSVDPSTWFVDSAGVVLDPTDATKHEAIAVAICKTLDTQVQGEGGGGKGGKHGGGGGGRAHCVEVVP